MRKTVEITISDEGRDRGKTFVIEEMAAVKAEEWGARALLAVSRSGIDLPDHIAGSGLAGIAMLGLRALAGVHFEDARRLMDEMLDCVKIRVEVGVRPLLRESDIEEIKTLLVLRQEVFKIHTGFSFADILSKWTSKTESAA